MAAAAEPDANRKSVVEVDRTCAICTDHCVDPRALPPCLHTFCLECLRKYCAKNDAGQGKETCPICSKAFVVPPGGVDELALNFYFNGDIGGQLCICRSTASKSAA